MIILLNSPLNFYIKFYKSFFPIIKKKLKALLLSAGLGTRLRPLTLNTPKCLMKINDEELLINWLNKLEKVGCNEVLINTHYLYQRVEEVLKKWNKSNLKITTVYEEQLLGTAGTLRKNLNFFKNANVLLIHADNYTNLDLSEFLNSFYKRNRKCLLSMVTFTTNNPKECGIVQVDDEGIMQNYFEKTLNPPSNIANGAIFAFEENFLDFFSLMPPTYNDFCADIVPQLKGKIQTYYTNSILIDIGRLDSLKLARKYAR